MPYPVYMTKDPQILVYLEAKATTIENLEAIKLSLVRCIDEGMIDLEDAYYNELLGLIDEAHLADSWDELSEVIGKAKTFENEVAVWFSLHGRTSLSLPWPRKPK